MKQKNNAQFAFLDIEHKLNLYYRYLVQQIRSGAYRPSLHDNGKTYICFLFVNVLTSVISLIDEDIQIWDNYWCDFFLSPFCCFVCSTVNNIQTRTVSQMTIRRGRIFIRHYSLQRIPQHQHHRGRQKHWRTSSKHRHPSRKATVHIPNWLTNFGRVLRSIKRRVMDHRVKIHAALRIAQVMELTISHRRVKKIRPLNLKASSQLCLHRRTFSRL